MAVETGRSITVAPEARDGEREGPWQERKYMYRNDLQPQEKKEQGRLGVRMQRIVRLFIELCVRCASLNLVRRSLKPRREPPQYDTGPPTISVCVVSYLVSCMRKSWLP